MGQLRDGRVPSVIAAGVGHPAAPAGRKVGIQVARWNAEDNEYESVTLYLTIEEASTFCIELISAIREAAR